MHAVIRETTYRADRTLEDSPEFKAFQTAHASRPGYLGTIVTAVGEGRYLTVTLWDNADDMHAARDVLGPVAEKLLGPMMVRHSKLVGTGPIVVKDF